MRIHFLGICGTFMGNLAVLAKELGYVITGQDKNIYPPMSTLLLNENITLINDYKVEDLPNNIDLYVIGNVMSRGMPVVEYILNNNLNFISGPDFLNKYVLRNKHVFVVTGTHGKTTTTSILTWILDYLGYKPGYLIGGIANNFKKSASLGDGKYFVIEGDEYDTAFFDKRSKFLHYNPSTVILNNLEFDHADIFKDLDSIKQQFSHLLKIIPSNGSIIYNKDDNNILDLIKTGCWSKKYSYSLKDNADFNISKIGNIDWNLFGDYNLKNAIAAIASANSIGIKIKDSLIALKQFKSVKRRMDIFFESKYITMYDDFAHHPTAIENAIKGLKNKSKKPIIAIIELASNTMKSGIHKESLLKATTKAEQVIFYCKNKVNWDFSGKIYNTVEDVVNSIKNTLNKKTDLLLMGNSSFVELKQKLIEKYK